MSNVTHLRFEIVRTLRNRTFFAVTLALPLVLFYAVASASGTPRSMASASRCTS